MRKVILDMSMSLDGFIAGQDDTDGGLHNWYFSPSDKNREIIDELIQTTGAIVMGRRSYDMGDQYDGYVDNPYRVPHFVLTHAAPDRPAKGTTAFTFVRDGVESMVRQARDAAGDRDVVLGGGADTAKQFLSAGFIDEIHIHQVPVLLGTGLRLFDALDTLPRLEIDQVIAAEGVTHLKFRVLK